MNKEHIYTVSQFNRLVKDHIESSSLFQEFFLEGELSGVTYYKSGHLYFSLKDKNAQIKCVAFNYKLKRIQEDLKEGDEVKLFGDLGFYENRGDCQVLVRHIEKKSSLGKLFAQLEKIKKEMREAGYFSEQNKKRIPQYPRNIGVVTAITGAAIHDIIKTIKKRDSRINIYVYPAKVQGIGAKKEIIKGIETLNKIEEIDFIIAGRGGGSIEDLWAFNEYETAMAFYNSNKPIISAVGHESDVLLTDFVADVRAATPTQAVELSIPERKILLNELKNKEKYLKSLLLTRIEKMKKELFKRKNNYFIKDFKNIIINKNQELVEREKKLYHIMQLIYKSKENEFNIKLTTIINLNPLKVLERGFCVAKLGKNGKILKSIKDAKISDEIDIKVLNGTIKTEIKEIIDEKSTSKY